MIINTGGRTDTVQYYTPWLLERFRQGFVYTRNPLFPSKVIRYELDPSVVDCVVFCSKNYRPILPHLREITDRFHTYFFYTITAYGKDIEPNVPLVDESIETLAALSLAVGRQRVAWRYDPVLLSGKYTVERHLETFRYMAEKLAPHIDRCIFSFVDSYRGSPFRELEDEEKITLAEGLAKIADRYGLPLYTCAEKIDLEKYGIRHAACIDKEKIREIIGYKLDLKKDRGQRKECGCCESIDIGMYDTCVHGCHYCYATASLASAKSRRDEHDPKSPILIGHLQGDETITDREVESSRDIQLSLFDFM